MYDVWEVRWFHIFCCCVFRAWSYAFFSQWQIFHLTSVGPNTAYRDIRYSIWSQTKLPASVYFVFFVQGFPVHYCIFILLANMHNLCFQHQGYAFEIKWMNKEGIAMRLWGDWNYNRGRSKNSAKENEQAPFPSFCLLFRQFGFILSNICQWCLVLVRCYFGFFVLQPKRC